MATEVVSQQQQTLQSLTPVEPERDGYHDVITTLNYYRDSGDGSGPMPIYIGRETVKNERPSVPQTVVVRDITGDEDAYILDRHGFQLIKHQTAVKDFFDEETALKEYSVELEEIFKKHTGAVRVFTFDYKVRHGPSHWHRLGENNTSQRGPVNKVHIDQSPKGAEIILRKHLPDEADELLKKRYQIVNVWRPLKPVDKDPLAVADARSVADADLVPAPFYRDGLLEETFTVRPNPAHRWHFKYHQQPDEAWLLKCFDSDPSVAGRSPHSAFRDPDEVDKPNRESIETRNLVFYDY